MYFNSKPNLQMDAQIRECKRALAQLSAGIQNHVLSEGVISSQSSLYSKFPRDGSIYIISEGTLKCVRANKLMYFLEEGDLLGFEGSSHDPEMDFFAEFAVSVKKIDPKCFLQSDESMMAWTKFQSSFLGLILGSGLGEGGSQNMFSPEVRSIEAGQEICVQGSFGTEVFSLVDGVAEIEVDGNVVGEVLPDQLFGVVSLMTSSERIATVRAVSDCLVVVMSKEQFNQFLESKPETVIRLAEDLSRAIMLLKDSAGLMGIAG